MNLGNYSRVKILTTANKWEVPREYVDSIYGYLVYGLDPGSFFTSLLANDFFNAMAHSHPGNNVLALKNMTNWIRSLNGEKVFWGSYSVVKKWTKTPEQDRRKKLEELGIIFSEQDEILMILRNDPCREPLFFN
jgi:hypothetical protein